MTTEASRLNPFADLTSAEIREETLSNRGIGPADLAQQLGTSVSVELCVPDANVAPVLSRAQRTMSKNAHPAARNSGLKHRYTGTANYADDPRSETDFSDDTPSLTEEQNASGRAGYLAATAALQAVRDQKRKIAS